MNDILKLVFLTLIQPLIDAIDRNTAAKGGTLTPCNQGAQDDTQPAAPAAAPKERKKKVEAAPAPAPEPAPEPEPEAEKVPTGEELVVMMAPLCEDPWKTKCIEFKKNTLKFNEPTRKLEDPALRAKFAEFITKLLAEKEASPEEV